MYGTDRRTAIRSAASQRQELVLTNAPATFDGFSDAVALSNCRAAAVHPAHHHHRTDAVPRLLSEEARGASALPHDGARRAQAIHDAQ